MWPIGRLWRVCMVGIGVCMALVFGVYGVGVRCAGVVWVRCYGVCGYGVYGVGCTYG